VCVLDMIIRQLSFDKLSMHGVGVGLILKDSSYMYMRQAIGRHGLNNIVYASSSVFLSS